MTKQQSCIWERKERKRKNNKERGEGASDVCGGGGVMLANDEN